MGFNGRNVFRLVAFCVMILMGGCGAVLPDSTTANFMLDFHMTDSATTIVSDESSVFFEEPIFEVIHGMMGSHAASITAFDEGELLAAWYSYPGEDELNGSRIYLSRKMPGNVHWSDPELHIDRPNSDGNPVLYSEGDRVWLFQAVTSLGWSTSHIEFQVSDDRGRSWSMPRRLSNALGSNTKYPPVRLTDGTLMLPAYDDLLNRSLFFTSDDGEQWNLRSTVRNFPGNIQPSIVQLSDGQLLAVMRNKIFGCLWIMASEDEGQSWLSPQDSGFPNPASAAELVRLSNGKLILVYNDSTEVRRPLSIAISVDEGKTWSKGKVLADGSATYSYPFAIESPDGLIHIVYSLDRLRIQHITLNEAWVNTQ
jgi:predicted neuraminidase